MDPKNIGDSEWRTLFPSLSIENEAWRFKENGEIEVSLLGADGQAVISNFTLYYSIDTSKKPHEFNFLAPPPFDPQQQGNNFVIIPMGVPKPPMNRDPNLGIFKIEGDVLTICEGKDKRPKEFDKTSSITLKRGVSKGK